jgi:uncharacterized protein (DUF427 family)
MVLKVNYNKSTGNITVESDLSAVNVEVSDRTIADDSNELSFEVSIDTSVYEEIQEQTEIE